MKYQHIFLFFTIIINLSAISQSCLPDGILFETQSQIDSFPINYPSCNYIEGNIEIRSSESTNITNFNGLNVLDSVGANLKIWYNYALQDLTGLDNLTSVGCDLTIESNNYLQNLSGLNNLSIIGGDFEIRNNDQMQNINSLGNLSSISGDLFIYDNSSLSNLFGLEGLSKINAKLKITMNYSLTNLEGLNNIDSVGGNLEVTMNSDLVNLSGLESLTFIGGVIRIYHNWDLISLTGLEGLINHQERIEIKDNIDLLNLSGLNNLTFIGRGMHISGNDAMTSLTGLESLTTVDGWYFYIGFNDALLSLDGLDNLTTVNDIFTLKENISLTDISALSQLSFVGRNLDISDCPISSLEGLENLNYIGEDLWIVNNENLSNFNGLGGLDIIGGDLWIWGNNSLTDLNGLKINQPDSLTNLRIAYNSNLAICEVQCICYYIENQIGPFEIHNNEEGCNNENEIKTACQGVNINSQELIEEITVLPNPAISIIQITGTHENNVNDIKIYNQIGKIVCQTKNKLNINIERLSPGLYFIEINTKQKLVYKRLVKN